MRLCSHGHEKVDGHLAEWLFTVCRNRALDLRRRERRMTLLTEDQDTEARNSSPELTVENRDAAGRVMRLLEGLSENLQTVIRLKFQNGLSYREISEVTGLTVSNVGFLIHRGLKTIRERMRESS